MFTHTLHPVAVSFGPFTLFWYGLLFLGGTLLSLLIARKLLMQHAKLSKRQAESLLFLLLVGMLIGARIGSVLSELPFYLAQPTAVFAVWQGGLAFHGGLAGSIVAVMWFARKHRLSLFALADSILVSVPLGLAIGRIGNFINGEFYGTVTTLPWGVLFPNVAGARHPVQLYESLAYLALFALLFFFSRRNIPTGFVTALFFAGYALIRFSLETVKDLPSFALSLTWGQFWSIPMLVFALYLFRKLTREKQKINK